MGSTKIKALPYKIFSPIRDFFNDSRATGVILIACTIVSLVVANFAKSQSGYTGFWHIQLTNNVLGVSLPENPLSWVNDVLMAFFFFMVALEIKRELTIGELNSFKRSLLPVLAALGGMVCPAIIFAIFNATTEYKHGWGIPMATDIAFSLGVLSLLGKKVPVQLKIFLAALAIIDDLGAIVTIAIFYASTLKFFYLLVAVLAIGVVIVFNKLKVGSPVIYLIPAAILWYALFNSGVHPTIAGVIMAFGMPLSKLGKIEHLHHIPVNFVIMPLFALANTAIILPADMGSAFTSTISYGIILGLVVGKPVGIFLFSFIASKLGIASMPSKSSYKQLLGIGMLGGIGFTMSIFTSTLAYSQESLQIISKVSVIVASFSSSVIGFVYLARLKPIAAEQLEEATLDTISTGTYENGNSAALA